MTNENKQKKAVDRRSFLRGLGFGAAGAAGAASVAAFALNGAAPAEAKPASDKPSVGYSETDHVKRVYSAARF